MIKITVNIKTVGGNETVEHVIITKKELLQLACDKASEKYYAVKQAYADNEITLTSND